MDKKTLSSYRAMVFEIEQLEELIARIEARSVEPKTPKLSNSPKGKGNVSDSIASNYARLESLRSMYAKKLERLTKAADEFEAVIEELKPLERTVMRYRYMEALSFKKIAKKMKYSEQHIKNIHWQTVKKITSGKS